MPDESVVYVVQEPPFTFSGGKSYAKDLSSAQRYGRIEFLLTRQDQASATPGECLKRLETGLLGFDPELDYLCYAGGDPMSLALALVALRNIGFEQVCSLRWERERDPDGRRIGGGFYVPITVFFETGDSNGPEQVEGRR